MRVSPPVVIATDSERFEARLRDLSVTGAGVMLHHDLDVGTPITLEIHTVGSFRGTVLRRTGDGLSIGFESPTPKDREAIADYLQVFKVMYGGRR